MSDQPEALRLADALRDGMPYDEAEIENELRRLHEQNERLRIVAGMSTLLLDQRDALLEALKGLMLRIRTDFEPMIGWGIVEQEMAHEAIKLVEGEKE